MFEKQIVFLTSKVFSDRNRNFKSTFPAHYAIAKTGDFEILNYFTASTKETIICTSCAVLKTVLKNEPLTPNKKRPRHRYVDPYRVKYPVLFLGKF
jgi:hypothetical protein